jgi:hypothetical protein
MFISRREAEERLAEDRNIFRDPSQPALQDESDCDPEQQIESHDDVGGDDAIVKRSAKGTTVHRQSGITQSRAGKAGTESESEETDSSSLSLAQLDSLLHPRINGRANYRGRLESQVAIAETSLIIGQTKTHRVFDLSEPQTQAYTRGLSSTSDITSGTPPKPELIKRINKIKEQLAEKAAARLDLTLEAMSATKISEIKRATNLSKVAKDMAVILDKCTDTKEDGRGGVHFHIYRPEPALELAYPTVTVGPKLEGIPSVSSIPSTGSSAPAE